MGAPRAGTNPALTDTAAVLDFAVTQIMRDDSTLDALPAVLNRLVTAFGVRAALAFQPSPSPPATLLAAYPRGADDPALLTRIGRLPMTQRSNTQRSNTQRSYPQRSYPAAAAATVELPLKTGSALVAYSAPVAGHCLCALALVGDVTSWDEEIRSTTHAVASLVAAQIHHASERARLAGRQALAQRDLSEIEHSYATLADQAERLSCLIAVAIPGVLITDERGSISHISQSFGTMFDVDVSGLRGTAAISTMRRIEREFAEPAEFVRRTAGILRARMPVSGDQIMAADGRTIECDYWPVLVDGRYRGDVWLLWDMSDRAELARQHEEQNFLLRELDEARNQFVAMVSHELRTPLTSIVSFSELIRGEAEGLTPDGRRFLDVIERNADRLLRLIGDLLLLSRLEAGVLPLDVAPVSIPELVTEAVRAASTAPATVSQGISVDISTGTGPAVRADSRRLLQVLDNLIGNAVKFSHMNGRVHVAAAYDGRTWRVDVADSGIGIPPSEAARLFGRFVRASNAQTAGLPGTGLGLSIVKQIVEMHGGHVELDTALDRGTTFSVYLPAAS
jgi:signal transduction histidine kinase